MKIAILLLSFLCIFTNAQDFEKLSKEVKEEGVELYRSEMASWYGTDIFRTTYKDFENVGGYFSYIDNQVPKCIFFSKTNKVIGTISFPTNYNPQNAKVEIMERNFTSIERDYFTIRQKALTRINNDTIFKSYKNTNFNIVPLIKNKIKKVYVLTGPSIDNIVVFGNDYLISYNDKNEIKKVEKLHKGIIIQKIYDEKTGKTVGGAHSHVLEDWQTMTPTDICTLMLYQKFTNWNQYITISKKYASIWNGKSETLEIMNSDDYQKLDEEKK